MPRLRVEPVTCKPSGKGSDPHHVPNFPTIQGDPGFLEPFTQFPKSVTYASMQTPGFLQVPDLIVLLLERMDKFVPPLPNLFNGYTADLLNESEVLLSALIHGGDFHAAFIGRELDEASPTQLCILLQLFLLRLEYPPLLASEELCGLLSQEDFPVTPIVGVCNPVTYDFVAKELKASLVGSLVAQNATYAFIMERFQRWCQKELAFRLAGGGSSLESAEVYKQAVDFLARLFSNSLIGINNYYLAANRMRTCCHISAPDMKQKIVRLCLGFIPSRFWHDISLHGIIQPPLPGSQTALWPPEKAASAPKYMSVDPSDYV
nr:unnamed protein product [Spirometra erinaceieuropaei]